MAKNILKEAIADAKAVREVALANAKAALEEAFTPKLQSMLSAKLSEELEDEYNEEMYSDEADSDELYFEEDTIEGEEEGEEGDLDEEINLEDILNELELEDEDSEEEVDEGYQQRVHAQADDVQNINYKVTNIQEDEEFNLDVLLNEINNLDDEEELDEEFNLEIEDDEIYEAKEEDEDEVTESKGCGCANKNSELNETKIALNTVRAELNEVNLLNSKLLYVNRIFKANTLDDTQKLRVVETLDKAENIKEAKLIYETIKDTFNVANTKKISKKTKTRSLREGLGMASRAAGTSTAPRKEIITESDNMVSRFQKLANISINE